MNRQAPTRRRNNGGSKPSSCLTLPALVLTKRSSDFSSRKAVSRSMARTSSRASADQRLCLAIRLGFGVGHTLELGHGEAEVRKDVLHGNGTVPFERIQAGLNGGAVFFGQFLVVVIVDHHFEQRTDR